MTGRLSILAIVLATGLIQCLPVMPGLQVWGAVVLGVMLSSFMVACVQRLRGSEARWGWRVFLPLWAGLLGLLITAARAEYRLADELTAENENKVSRVVLQVAALVKVSPDSRQFEALVLSSKPAGVPSRIQVSWNAGGYAGPYGRSTQKPHDFPTLVPGQVWRMSLTLKKPHAAINPHAFDFESYMFANNLRASGSVRGQPVYLYDEAWTSLPIVAQRARHYVREAMRPYIEGKRYGAVLLALTIGDQASVDSADWDVFNRTGITHLVSISGSHITMIAALGGMVVLWGWRRLQFRGRALADRFPATVAAALAALLIAWLYCLLAGWGVPARRTFLMLSVIATAHVLRIPLNISRLLCLVAFAVVVLDPWALLASGFWLSFGAVYVLMASSGWWGRSMAPSRAGRWQKAWAFLYTSARLQLAITVGLMPLLALIFHQVSLASPLANAYAIPVISLVVTPLSLLLAAVAFVPGLEWLAEFIAWLAHQAMFWSMQPTVWLAQLDLASFDAAAAPPLFTLIALAGLFIAVMPYGLPMRNAAWLLMLPALFWRAERPPEGGWSLFALDVGQASGIVVQTSRHVLVFDTGLRSSPGNDGAARTIVPFLRAMGVRKLDVVVVSHVDIDHSGGVRSLLDSFRTEQSYSSFDLRNYLKREAYLLDKPGVLPALPLAMSLCEYGVTWRVDGVAFEFLWPLKPAVGARSPAREHANDRSCVLRIRGQYHSALLTADIGLKQENAIVNRGLEPLDVVIAAHHGSKNSSGQAFVDSVGARHVVAQAGAWNRYGHPSPLVQQRWEQAGATFWRTDQHGAITVKSSPDALLVQNARSTGARYWHGR